MNPVSRSALGARLAEFGFRTHPGGFFYARPSSIPGVFEGIQVTLSVRRLPDQDQELARGAISLSTCQWTAGNGPYEFLTDIAKDGFATTIIRNAQAARAWEADLVRVAVPKVEALVLEAGARLLEETAEPRAIARQCLAPLNPTLDLLPQIWSLQDQLPVHKVNNAKRLAEWAGVRRFEQSEGADVFLLACLSVERWDAEDRFLGQDPLRNKLLMNIVLHVADGIVEWPCCDQFMGRSKAA